MIEDKVVNLLDFPRYQVREYLDLSGCPHSGYYDAHDRRCRDCEFGMECEWLNRNDEIATLKQQRLEELDKALDLGICYVQSRATGWGHDTRACHCDSCEWLREAQRTRSQVQGVLEALAWIGLKTARRTEAEDPSVREGRSV
ncbi:MAG TPA: hypothetical protein VKA76_07235 [Gammaproteobacteria bacterium]|nr:hypothetical protein [Gammaproteobacteria bacterium]